MYDRESSSRDVRCCNPQTNQWELCASMTKLRASPNVVVVKEVIYVLGGTSRTIKLVDVP